MIIFINTSFINNKDLSFQIEYIIVLMDKYNKANIIHWLSIKCKRVIRSVLASELYGMVLGFDISVAIKGTIDKIFPTRKIPLIIYIDSKSFYNCFTKLDTTNEKRLIINVIAIRKVYKKQKIVKIKWIDKESNSINTITKSKLYQVFKDLVNNNTITIKVIK